MSSDAVNTTALDDGLPSLRSIAEAISIDSWRLPEGFEISEQDFRDCLREGARRGEILVSGIAPPEILQEWDDDPADLEPGEEPQHHVETQERHWGFRIRIDQICED